MLQRNIIEQVKNALDHAVSSGHSELEERLNICKMVLGTYAPRDDDLSRFQRANAEDFEDFYATYLYRTPDVVVPNGSGVVYSLNKTLNTLGELRQRFGISQPDLDKITKELEEKQQDIVSFSDIKARIEQATADLDRLNQRKKTLENEIQKMRELERQVDDVTKQIDVNSEILSGESFANIEKRIIELRTQLNGQIADNNLIKEIIRQATGIGLLSKVNLDLLCEYIEDKNIMEKLISASMVENDSLQTIREYEANLDLCFKGYRDCLYSIVQNLPPRNERIDFHERSAQSL
jgi:hypothetical protein